MKKIIAALVAAALALCALAACQQQAGTRAESEEDEPKQSTSARRDAAAPALPEGLDIGEDGAPVITIYDTEAEAYEEVGIEDYVMGVLAGEMRNDWPMEALKAQAILARTFVLKFIDEKESKYPGAQISTDVSEAQAYAPGDVNDRVRKAVQDTRGMVLSANGELPYAWFHAHSGGMTELPSVSLDFRDEDPAYLKPVASEESEKAPADAAHWEAAFTEREVVKACSDAGLKVEHVDTIALGDKGESGRARTLVVNGDSVSAPSFRIQIGPNRLRSTLIDSVELEDGRVTFRGRGFGHGVGMSQWGAYAMAERGDSAEDIIEHYFNGVSIVKLW